MTAEQLAIRAGQVRCGQCKTVFDGSVALIPLAPAPPVAPVAPAGVPPAAMLAAPADDAGTPIAYEDRFAPTRRRSSSRAMGAVYAIAAPLLVLLLGAQAVFHFSSAMANRWPGMAPALTQFCEVAGCAVRPLRDADMRYLAIESSDLYADPAHKGLLALTATIRNRAGWALAFPHLELTLTDAQDQVVVRRALAPADYAGGTVELANGIGANGEIAIKLFIDASATVQAGYRLYLFYP